MNLKIATIGRISICRISILSAVSLFISSAAFADCQPIAYVGLSFPTEVYSLSPMPSCNVQDREQAFITGLYLTAEKQLPEIRQLIDEIPQAFPSCTYEVANTIARTHFLSESARAPLINLGEEGLRRYVRRIFLGMLGQEPLAGVVEAWMARFTISGLSGYQAMQTVADTISTGDEFKSRVQQICYPGTVGATFQPITELPDRSSTAPVIEKLAPSKTLTFPREYWYYPKGDFYSNIGQLMLGIYNQTGNDARVTITFRNPDTGRDDRSPVTETVPAGNRMQVVVGQTLEGQSFGDFEDPADAHPYHIQVTSDIPLVGYVSWGQEVGIINYIEALENSPDLAPMAEALTCESKLKVAPTELTATNEGGYVGVNVDMPASCPWMIMPTAEAQSWVAVTSPKTGAGPAQVVLSVSPNPSGEPRKAEVFVNGQLITVNQR